MIKKMMVFESSTKEREQRSEKGLFNEFITNNNVKIVKTDRFYIYENCIIATIKFDGRSKKRFLRENNIREMESGYGFDWMFKGVAPLK